MGVFPKLCRSNRPGSSQWWFRIDGCQACQICVIIRKKLIDVPVISSFAFVTTILNKVTLHK